MAEAGTSRKTRRDSPAVFVAAPQHLALLERVVAAFELPLSAITRHSRKRPVARARHIAVYVLRHRFGLSFARIGILLGNRDHSTIISSFRSAEALVAGHSDLDELARELIQGGPVPMHDSHVLAWIADRVRRGLRPRPPARRASPEQQRAVAFMAIRAAQQVKPKNRISEIDEDAIRRHAAVTELGRAIEAAGGWR